MLSKELGGEEDIERYRKRLNQLYQQRKDIVNNIKILVRRKRLINDSANDPAKQLKASIATLNSKARKAYQTTTPTSTPNNKKQKKQLTSRAASRTETNVSSAASTATQRKRRAVLSRRREKLSRKCRLKRTRSRSSERCRRSCNSKSERSWKQQQLGRLTEQKDKNSKELLLTENIILKNKFIAYVSDLSHSLPTSHLPVITWKPASNNQNTSKLYQQHTQNIQTQAKQVIDEIMNYNQKFDFTQYTLQNQRQYYNNLLQRHFNSQQHFVTTKTAPHLRWTPSAYGWEKAQEALKQSKARLIEDFNKKREENDHFYHRFEKQHQAEQQIEQGQSESGH